MTQRYQDTHVFEGRETAAGRATRREIGSFLAITFAITWGIAALAVFAGSWLLGPEGFGGARARVLFILAVYGPTIAGLVLTLRKQGLRQGLREIVAGAIAPGRTGAFTLWLLISVCIMPAAWGLSWALSHLSLEAPNIGFLSWGRFGTVAVALVTTAYFFTDAGPLGEEYGWRGYLLPRLLRVTDPIRASILIGVVWGVWHLPAFFNGGTNQSASSRRQRLR